MFDLCTLMHIACHPKAVSVPNLSKSDYQSTQIPGQAARFCTTIFFQIASARAGSCRCPARSTKAPSRTGLKCSSKSNKRSTSEKCPYFLSGSSHQLAVACQCELPILFLVFILFIIFNAIWRYYYTMFHSPHVTLQPMKKPFAWDDECCEVFHARTMPLRYMNWVAQCKQTEGATVYEISDNWRVNC